MFSSENTVAEFSQALENKQFVVYFQPQYHLTTGLLIGAEALVRWVHPQHGLIAPNRFVPEFERENMISNLDLYVFDEICRAIHCWMEEEIYPVPVSINLSRNDIYQEGFIEKLNEIRQQYEVPSDLLRVEIIESIAMEGSEKAQNIIEKFHQFGFKVALDDFGSGYSSLNVLKDIDYDVLKLDMQFLSNDNSGKGRIIITSIVRMAEWLNLPVIVEGVETQEQFSFMKSIGCDYVQGFFFSRPIPDEDFKELMQKNGTGLPVAPLQMKGNINPIQLWKDDATENVVFNFLVGPASVFRYGKDGSLDYLRVNEKFTLELGTNMSAWDFMRGDFWSTLDETNRKIYQNALELAIKTEEEQECEIWMDVESACCGSQRLCVRHHLLMIGKSDREYIFYSRIRNITAEKKISMEALSNQSKLETISEQAKIYYWEYSVATQEMRPCFRCMRDFGLPLLVKNYPEPVIEMGLFPSDYAELYRDWHRQIAEGASFLEAVIPLTVGRIPFHVRYTTEFDELGRPVKAFGSATLVTPVEREGNKGKI